MVDPIDVRSSFGYNAAPREQDAGEWRIRVHVALALWKVRDRGCDVFLDRGSSIAGTLILGSVHRKCVQVDLPLPACAWYSFRDLSSVLCYIGQRSTTLHRRLQV